MDVRRGGNKNKIMALRHYDRGRNSSVEEVKDEESVVECVTNSEGEWRRKSGERLKRKFLDGRSPSHLIPSHFIPPNIISHHSAAHTWMRCRCCIKLWLAREQVRSSLCGSVPRVEVCTACWRRPVRCVGRTFKGRVKE